MKVKALENGFFGQYRATGDVFEVPDGSKATWFEPVKDAAADKTPTDPNPKKTG